MEKPQWREEAGGAFVAETAEFTMRVHRKADRQYVRYVVLKRTGVLVGSGTTNDIGTAMNAAENMAEQFSATRKSDRCPSMVVEAANGEGASQWDGARLNWSVPGRSYPADGRTGDAGSGGRSRGLYEGFRSLIAEDTSSTAWFLYDILAEAGYDIVGPAATSKIAAELVARSRLDAALLDINLADGPSFSVAESLAARGIPFAFLSGYDAGDIPLHLRDRPIVGKPIGFDRVLNVVIEICGPAGKYAHAPA
jgi:CheY-like chemotaxis protein